MNVGLRNVWLVHVHSVIASGVIELLYVRASQPVWQVLTDEIAPLRWIRLYIKLDKIMNWSE